MAAIRGNRGRVFPPAGQGSNQAARASRNEPSRQPGINGKLTEWPTTCRSVRRRWNWLITSWPRKDSLPACRAKDITCSICRSRTCGSGSGTSRSGLRKRTPSRSGRRPPGTRGRILTTFTCPASMGPTFHTGCGEASSRSFSPRSGRSCSGMETRRENRACGRKSRNIRINSGECAVRRSRSSSARIRMSC